MDHPYTKLLEELNGSRYVRFQKERGLVYSWNGTSRIEVYNMEGACVDFFGTDEGMTIDDVSGAIETHMVEDL
jgi:hypothetical protein